MMEFNAKLKGLELLKESFEKLTSPFEDLTDEVKVSMQTKIKMGSFYSRENDEKSGIIIEYNFIITQMLVNEDKNVSNLDIKFLAIFEEEDSDVIVNLIKEKQLNDKDTKKIVITLNNIAYPYIKDYIELKYNKANIKINLPLELEI